MRALPPISLGGFQKSEGSITLESPGIFNTRDRNFGGLLSRRFASPGSISSECVDGLQCTRPGLGGLKVRMALTSFGDCSEIMSGAMSNRVADCLSYVKVLIFG